MSVQFLAWTLVGATSAAAVAQQQQSSPGSNATARASDVASGSGATAKLVLPPFKLLRYEEDYSTLASAEDLTGLDRLKYMKLTDDGRAWLSLGGEARTRYEYTSAPFFGLRGSSHDVFVLQRFLLHADARYGERTEGHARAFVQLVSGLVAGEEFPKPGNQDDALDVQQAFAELAFGDERLARTGAGDPSISVRVGRQEMGFGSFRLVTIREPTNARLTFDGVRATYTFSGVSIDAFLVRPVVQEIGLFNDGEDDNTTFWGLHAAIALAPERRMGLDVYAFGLNREDTRFQSGIGDELRHSIGTRLWGRADGWDHDTEVVFQFGTFDTQQNSEDILAWTVASNTGYTFENAAWKPRIGLKVNVASGDSDPNDNRLGTFNPLFPRNNYFNDANLLAPYNFFDFHPSISVRPTDSLTLTAACDVFFRFSEDDAVFSPTGIVIPANASDNLYVGTSVSLTAEWAINRSLFLSASYVHFFRGDVVRDAGGDDVDYFGISFSGRF